jgi:hypothetical protein
MKKTAPLAEHLAPDTIRQLENAAKKRYDDAEKLAGEKCFLTAIYLYGYSAEMCLGAAFFRSAGFGDIQPIELETRNRRMAQAKSLKTPSGEPLMNKDPHPLVGWARFLLWMRESSRKLSSQESRRLNEAINKAQSIYRHWRPQLRYKSTEANLEQVEEVRKAATWFIENRGRL